MISAEAFKELTSKSMRTFETYAGYSGLVETLPSESNTDKIRILQIRFARWEVYNFGWQDTYRPLLGIGEEVCDELDEARDGEDRDKVNALIKDSAADAGIFMMNMFTSLRLDFATVLKVADASPMSAHHAARGVGKMNHALLKYEQGIRGMDRVTALARIVEGSFIVLAGLGDLCDVYQAIFDTAPEVLKRDWRKNKKTGA